MNALQNLDLFSVGIAVATTGLLGFIVFLNNRASITNRTFLLFALSTVFWGVTNYFAYQTAIAKFILWFFRLVLFFAIYQAFFLFQLFYVFPSERISFPKWYKYGLIPLVAVIAILTLTPLIFSGVAEVASPGQASKTIVEPGILLFGLVAVGLVIAGLVLLIKKTIKAKSEEKKPLFLILLGTFITFSLIITFNFIIAGIFLNVRYIPLGAVFILPFAGFTTYSILKHRFLNVKIIATEILIFVLTIAVFLEIIFAQDLASRLLRSGVFLLVLSLGILLIRSVRKEVEQRERLEQLTKELEVANKKLEYLNRLKSEFLSIASHQIRAPMSNVKGFLQLVFEGNYGQIPQPAREVLEKIYRNIDELIALINNLLDLRKIEEGKMEYNFDKIDLVPIVKDVFEFYQPRAKMKQLDYRFNSPDGAILANIDKEKLKQVFANLIDNAIKYTDSGFVEVDISDQGEKIVVAVKDSGRGIKPEDLDNIFKEFTREEGVKKTVIGSGLGLFIAKTMIEAHQGKIWAESAGEGQGAQFYVELKKTS